MGAAEGCSQPLLVRLWGCQKVGLGKDEAAAAFASHEHSCSWVGAGTLVGRARMFWNEPPPVLQGRIRLGVRAAGMLVAGSFPAPQGSGQLEKLHVV